MCVKYQRLKRSQLREDSVDEHSRRRHGSKDLEKKMEPWGKKTAAAVSEDGFRWVQTSGG